MGLIISGCSAVCCACQTCQSCAACLGKPFQSNGYNRQDDHPITASSGRKRSVFLFVLALVLALLFQYVIAPSDFGEDYWSSSCTLDYDENDADGDCSGICNEDEEGRCRENIGVYRVGFVSLIFFGIFAIWSYFSVDFNRSYWGAKFVLFLLSCVAIIFVDDNALFDDVFLNIARIGASIFVIIQQLILIDMAYNWNEYWVIASNEAEREELGSGKKYLIGILVASGVIFTFVLIFIGLMFHYFGSCDVNEGFLSVTLIGVVAVTFIQLSGEEGSLMTSAILSLYATYLVGNAMTKNPDEDCNPRLGKTDTLGIMIGIGIIVVSLAWLGYSVTAEERLAGSSEEKGDNQAQVDEEGNKESSRVVGHALGDNDDSSPGDKSKNDYGSRDNVVADQGETDQIYQESGGTGNTSNVDYSAHWKMNVILMLLTCWFSVSLTSWGTIESSSNAANPDTGRIAMWMIITSQWLVLLLYVWTLAAPKLFPDRDFN